MAIARPWLDSIRQSLSGKKIFILGPIADGDLTDACSLRSLETLFSPLPTQLVNVNHGSQSAFGAGDCLLFIADDQLDGQRDPERLCQHLRFAESALAAKAQVVISGTLGASPGPAVIAALQRLRGATFLVHDRLSLSRLASLVGNDMFFFPSFLLFDKPDFSVPMETLFKQYASQAAAATHQLVLNISEGCFRSLFDHHTDQNRRLFVGLVLDQIFCFSQQPFIYFLATSASDATTSALDANLHDMAEEWLRQNGKAQSYAIVPSSSSSSSSTAADLLFLFSRVDIGLLTSPVLLPAAHHSRRPFLALCGKRGSSDWLARMRSQIEEQSSLPTCIATELYAISYQLTRLLATASPRLENHSNEMIEGIATDRWQSALLAIFRQRTSRTLHQLTPDHSAVRANSGLHDQTLDMTSRHLQPRMDGTMYLLSDPAIHANLLAYATKYFQDKHAHSGRQTGDFSQISFDGDPSFIPELLERDQPHEEDYKIFRWFRGSHSLILDIGANWGYSAASIWTCAPDSHLVSFEAIPMYRPCLQALRELRSDQYAYILSGLSSRDGFLSFSIPVVNHTALTALTTAASSPCLPSLIDSVLNHVTKWMTATPSFSFQFIDFTVPVRRLDDLLAAHPSSLSHGPVAAIKVDVEGMEYEVLSGGQRTLAADRPMIMVEENQNRSHALVSLLDSLGYLRAERIDSCLQLSNNPGQTHYNGFFVHRERCSEYRDLGLLQ